MRYPSILEITIFSGLQFLRYFKCGWRGCSTKSVVFNYLAPKPKNMDVAALKAIFGLDIAINVNFEVWSAMKERE